MVIRQGDRVIFIGGGKRAIATVNAIHSGGGNWWEGTAQTCVAAYQPIGAANLAASYVNLANPGTYDAAPGVAPTWDAVTGWAFNGTTQNLVTGLTLGAVAKTIIVRMQMLGPANEFAYFVGSTNGGLATWGNAVRYSGSSVFAPAPTAAQTVLAVAHTTTNYIGYRNGVNETGTVSGAAVSGAVNIGIDGVTLYRRQWTCQALAAYLGQLTADEVAAVGAAMAAL